MGPNFVDEIDCGNFFDQIDDLIKFPTDADYIAGAGDTNNVPSMWNASLPEDNGELFSGSHADDLLAELSVPYEDIVQLEWLSTFVEDSFSSGGMTIGKENCTKLFQTSSPVSVLESSSSSSSSGSNSIGKTSPSHHGTQRARSKRPRPATFSPRAGIQLIPVLSPFIETPRPFVIEAENTAGSDEKNIIKLTAVEHQKKKMKITTTNAIFDAQSQQQIVRKCLHCEITKTPQWRAGPMGPKTLCNACGVRYKSGRLFPEYRPAASPTFVPALHSNSHKKVIEMRTTGSAKTT